MDKEFENYIVETEHVKWYEFKQGFFHTGYYVGGESVKKLEQVDNPEWNFEDSDDAKPGFDYESANVFVKGSCNIFAIALAKNTHIKTFNWFGSNDGLVHAFGMTTYKGMDAYVDVRGATTDFEEFIQPFSSIGESFNPIPQNVMDEYIEMNESDRFGYRFAERLICEHRDYYPNE